MPKCKNCKHLEQLEGMWCWCPIYNDSYDLNEERDCKDFINITNRDRILRMTEKELSEFICFASGRCNSCIALDYCESGGGAANGVLKWLQQEVKDDINGKQ